MAKSSGLAMTTFTVQDAAATARDLRNDFTNFQFSTPRAVQDVTGLDKSARETLLLLADFSVSITGVFNPTTNQSHTVFSTVPTTSVPRQVVITFASTPAATMTATCNFTDYQINRDAGGALTYTAPGVLQNGTAPAWT